MGVHQSELLFKVMCIFDWPITQTFNTDIPKMEECGLLWLNYIGHKDKILDKGYGIKCGDIGNNLSNNMGT